MLSIRCVLPGKKTSRYQRVYRNLRSSAIMFHPLTHCGPLMIWALKPGKLPSPKPDILQFVSLLLLNNQLFVPHCTGPLPHFTLCNSQLPPSAFLILSNIQLTFQKVLTFYPYSPPGVSPLFMKWQPPTHIHFLPHFKTHPASIPIWWAQANTHTHAFWHSKLFSQVSTPCYLTARAAYCSVYMDAC